MSTSKLQRQVSDFLNTHFGGYAIRENHRPDWLTTEDGARLELDFYIEELSLAVEVQGGQHYIYVPFFHGEPANFNKRLAFDRFKQAVCARRGIRLYEIATTTDIDGLLTFLPKQASDNAWALTDAEIAAKDKRIALDKATRAEAVKEHKRLLQEKADRPDGLEQYRQLKADWAEALKQGGKKGKRRAAELAREIQRLRPH